MVCLLSCSVGARPFVRKLCYSCFFKAEFHLMAAIEAGEVAVEALEFAWQNKILLIIWEFDAILYLKIRFWAYTSLLYHDTRYKSVTNIKQIYNFLFF